MRIYRIFYHLLRAYPTDFAHILLTSRILPLVSGNLPTDPTHHKHSKRHHRINNATVEMVKLKKIQVVLYCKMNETCTSAAQQTPATAGRSNLLRYQVPTKPTTTTHDCCIDPTEANCQMTSHHFPEPNRTWRLCTPACASCTPVQKPAAAPLCTPTPSSASCL